MLAEACTASVLALELAAEPAGRRTGVCRGRDWRSRGPGARVHERAIALTLSGRRAEASALLDRALPGFARESVDRGGTARELPGRQVLFWLERHDEAHELLSGLTHAARGQQRAGRADPPPVLRGRARAPPRPLGDGERPHLEDVLELEAEIAQSVFAAYADQTLARLAATTGDEARCHDHAGACRRPRRAPRQPVRSALRAVRSRPARVDARPPRSGDRAPASRRRARGERKGSASRTSSTGSLTRGGVRPVGSRDDARLAARPLC